MAKKVFNMEGGLHSAAAFTGLENRAYGSSVASVDSFVVSAAAGMNLNISTGDGLISVDSTLARRIQTDAIESVAVSPASTSYSRIDSVVAYIDTAVEPTTSVIDNVNGVLKFACVAGSAAATPQAPSSATIQSIIGAGKPYMVLYDVTIPQNATNTSGTTMIDRRKVFTRIDASQLPNNIIDTAKVQDGAITDAKKTTTHAFAATKGAESTVASATFTKVNFDVEFHDDGNNFANGRFTAPLAGKYLFTWHQATVGADNIITAIYVNGASRYRGFWNQTTGMTRSSNGTTVLKLSAGDIIEIYVYVTGGGLAVRHGGDYSQFTGAFLGA